MSIWAIFLKGPSLGKGVSTAKFLNLLTSYWCQLQTAPLTTPSKCEYVMKGYSIFNAASHFLYQPLQTFRWGVVTDCWSCSALCRITKHPCRWHHYLWNPCWAPLLVLNWWARPLASCQCCRSLWGIWMKYWVSRSAVGFHGTLSHGQTILIQKHHSALLSRGSFF